MGLDVAWCYHQAFGVYDFFLGRDNLRGDVRVLRLNILPVLHRRDSHIPFGQGF
jgi:hypothetical protein